jgi:UDP-N-acetylmuramyl tripeptide synthase
MMIIGVTGTNGKTSTTYMLESIMRQAGHQVGVIGTVNYRWAGREVPAPNTTPESRDIQQLLKTMLDAGVSCVVMEVSSHGLELMRADDIRLTPRFLRNLTRDTSRFPPTALRSICA